MNQSLPIEMIENRQAPPTQENILPASDFERAYLLDHVRNYVFGLSDEKLNVAAPKGYRCGILTSYHTGIDGKWFDVRLFDRTTRSIAEEGTRVCDVFFNRYCRPSPSITKRAFRVTFHWKGDEMFTIDRFA